MISRPDANSTAGSSGGCCREPGRPDRSRYAPAAMQTLLDFHRIWGYVAIAANGVAGLIALAAWHWTGARGRKVWVATIIAEAAMMLQVLVGTILVASKDYRAPRFHMFYGFIAFLTVGLAFQYRTSMRGRTEMLYGLVGLFLMGLGIRAVLQAGA